MDYEISDISPVRKKIVITFSAQEVNAAITKQTGLYKSSVRIDGFRKGKVPVSVIEKRFHNEIINEAKDHLISSGLKNLAESHQINPVSSIEVLTPQENLNKDAPYEYSAEFDVLPEFDLPPYEGLSVEQRKVEENEEELSEIIEKIRLDKAVWVEAEEKIYAEDGDGVIIDFEIQENGKVIGGLTASDFKTKLGINGAVPEFENIIKTIPKGQSGIGPVSFSEDFILDDIAGKTVDVKIRLQSIQMPVLPELNDKFAKEFGFDTIEAFKNNVKNHYLESRKKLYEYNAKEKLLADLLKNASFDLPKIFTDLAIQYCLAEKAAELENTGKGLSALQNSQEELKDDIKKEILPLAQNFARKQVFLLTVAKKEGLSVSEKETLMALLKISLENGKDFKKLKAEYENSGMKMQLKNRLLADKALDLIYSRANVSYIDGNSTADKD